MPARFLLPWLAGVVVVAALGGWEMATVFGVAIFGLLGVVYDRRRPRGVRVPPQGPAWGYEFPWLDQRVDPGMAYVGITTRAPLASGWLPRWDDDGHHAQRADVNMAAAVVYVFTSEVEARAWEAWRIAELATAGHSLLNVDGNPGRPAWEKLGLAA